MKLIVTVTIISGFVGFWRTGGAEAVGIVIGTFGLSIVAYMCLLALFGESGVSYKKPYKDRNIATMLIRLMVQMTEDDKPDEQTTIAIATMEARIEKLENQLGTKDQSEQEASNRSG